MSGKLLPSTLFIRSDLKEHNVFQEILKCFNFIILFCEVSHVMVGDNNSLQCCFYTYAKVKHLFAIHCLFSSRNQKVPQTWMERKLHCLKWRLWSETSSLLDITNYQWNVSPPNRGSLMLLVLDLGCDQGKKKPLTITLDNIHVFLAFNT